MKLYSGPLSMFGAKAEIALLEKGLEFERELVPFSLKNFYEPKHPEVVRVNPKQEVPVLIDGELELFDSTQIFEYLEDRYPEPALWPRDVAERALARQAELRADEVFFANVVLLMPRRRAEAGEEAAQNAIAAIHALYDVEEERLRSREFWMGDQLTYADIAFFMVQFFASFLGHPWAEGHESLDAWHRRMRTRASVKQVAGAMAAYLESHGIPAQSFD